MKLAKRITRSEVYGTFRMLCKAASKVVAETVKAEDRPFVGAWGLDYMVRAGYVIKEVTENGYDFPMGMRFRPAREMVRTMEFTIQVIERMEFDKDMRRLKAVANEAIRKAEEVSER